jgi:hypothetical protein
MERGEIQARSSGIATIRSGRPDWIRDKKVYFLAQIGAVRDKSLPNVPLVTQLATTLEQRRILQLISAPRALGRTFLAPPGVPGQQLAILRRAFQAALRDKIFLQEMNRAMIDIDPMSAEEVRDIVHDIIQASPEIVAKTKAAIQVR